MGSFSVWHFAVLGLIMAVVFAPLWIGLLVMGPQRKVLLTHRASGLQKNGYYGYSWTYLCFGFLVPIFRGEIGLSMLHLVFSVLTGGLFQLVMSYLYNKQFTQRQMVAGWEVANLPALDARARHRLALGTVIIPAPAPPLPTL